MTRRDVSELGARARAGDSDSFAELYRIYLPDVRDYCQRRTSDPHRAEELAQDVFERAWKAIGRFDSHKAFWPWLQVIASNLLVDEGRRGAILHLEQLEGSAAERMSSDDDVERQVVLSEERTELRGDLRLAFARLKPRSANIAWQRHEEDVSYEQIATRYSTSTASIRNTTWKATAVLRTALKEFGWRASWLAMASLRALRSLRRRARTALTRMQAEIGSGLDAAGQRVTVTVFGVAVVITGLLTSASLGGSSSAPPAPPATDREASRSAHVGGAGVSERQVLSASPGADGPLSTSNGSVAVGMKTGHRDRAAAPNEAHLTIEIIGPSGETLYQDEENVDCKWDSSAVPQVAPVRAWC